MTTSPVVTITDEQLAELEKSVQADLNNPEFQGDGRVIVAGVAALLERLRAAESSASSARVRIKELDLLFGRYLLGMKSAAIEMDHGRGAEAAMQWIINGLTGPGELPPDDETDAQAFFDREIKPIDDAMAELFKARRQASEPKP